MIAVIGFGGEYGSLSGIALALNSGLSHPLGIETALIRFETPEAAAHSAPRPIAS
jgi:hypothetical protein